MARAGYMQAYRDTRRARGQCTDCPNASERYARCQSCRKRRAQHRWRNKHIKLVHAA